MAAGSILHERFERAPAAQAQRVARQNHGRKRATLESAGNASSPVNAFDAVRARATADRRSSAPPKQTVVKLTHTPEAPGL